MTYLRQSHPQQSGTNVLNLVNNTVYACCSLFLAENMSAEQTSKAKENDNILNKYKTKT